DALPRDVGKRPGDWIGPDRHAREVGSDLWRGDRPARPLVDEPEIRCVRAAALAGAVEYVADRLSQFARVVEQLTARAWRGRHPRLGDPAVEVARGGQPFDPAAGAAAECREEVQRHVPEAEPEITHSTSIRGVANTG